ncbi:hypothetical protein [Vandammella animalimorsus]|nr:hypothetical protein [Vandammella animalimorsus]
MAVLENRGRIDCINWGSVASWAAIGSGVGGIIRSGANLGFRAELGRWGSRGSWTNNKRYRVPHFHLGHKKNGLGTHHLPFQGDKWIKNFKKLYKDGKIGDQLYDFIDMGLGFGVIGLGG